ncbi:MAG: hypothetical protein ABIN05_00050 [candidate division WOR-3 bacterium]
MKSILVGSGRVLYSIVIFLLTVVCSRLFSVDFYVNFREFILYFLIGINLAGIPATNTLYYFRERHNKNIFQIYMISFFFLLIFFFILFLISKSFLIPLSFIVSFSSMFFLVCEATSLSLRTPLISVFLNIFESLSFFIPIFIVFLFKVNEFMFFIYLLFLGFIKIVFYLLLTLLMNKKSKEYDKNEIIKFSLPLYFNGILGSISKQIDKFIVSLFYYGKSFADYSTGSFEIPLVARFFSGVFHERADYIKEKIEENKNGDLKRDFEKILMYSVTILGVLTLFFFINSKTIIRIFFSEKYVESYKFFMVYLTVLPLRNIPFGFLLSLKGKNFLLFLISLLDSFLTVLFSLVFAKFFNIFFVSFSFVIATFVSVFLTIFFIRDIFPSKVFVKRYFLIIFLLLVLIPLLNQFNNILLTCIFILIYMILDILLFWRKR